jgi:hypothetical protein
VIRNVLDLSKDGRVTSWVVCFRWEPSRLCQEEVVFLPADWNREALGGTTSLLLKRLSDCAFTIVLTDARLQHPRRDFRHEAH